MSWFCYQGCRNGEHEVKDRKEGWPHPTDKASTCPLCLWFAGPPATVLGCFSKSKTKGWRETLPFAALLKSPQRGPKVTIAHTQWLFTLMKHRNNCKWCPQSEFIEKEKRSSHWQPYMQKAGDTWNISPQFFLDFRLRTRNQYCTQAIAWGSTI